MFCLFCFILGLVFHRQLLEHHTMPGCTFQMFFLIFSIHHHEQCSWTKGQESFHGGHQEFLSAYVPEIYGTRHHECCWIKVHEIFNGSHHELRSAN